MNIDWLCHETKHPDYPSVTPPLNPPVNYSHPRKIDRVTFDAFSATTKHFVVSVPSKPLSCCKIIQAVNKHTMRLEYQDALLFPSSPGNADYEQMFEAACMRFVDWLKKKEANPFINFEK